MSDWRTPGQISGARPLAILGGKTMAENYSAAIGRWRNSGGDGGLPYGPHHAGLWPKGWHPYGVAPPQPPPRDLQADLPQHLARVGVPDRLAAILQGGLRQTPAVRAVAEWSATTSSLLLLHGDVDGGKSVAAASAFLHRKRANWSDGLPDWDSVGAFMDAAEVSANLFTDAGKELLAFLASAPLVVVDELGAEADSGPWHAALDHLVNKRFGAPALKTIFATNVSATRESEFHPSPFEVRYGSRIARRIRESGVVFACDKSWRAA